MYTIFGDASAGKIWEKKTLGVTTDQLVKIKKCKAVTMMLSFVSSPWGDR